MYVHLFDLNVLKSFSDTSAWYELNKPAFAI